MEVKNNKSYLDSRHFRYFRLIGSGIEYNYSNIYYFMAALILLCKYGVGFLQNAVVDN